MISKHTKAFIALNILIMAFLYWAVANNPEIPLTELTGAALHRLLLYLTVVLVTLTSLEHKKVVDQPLAFSVLASGILIGAAMVLSH